MNIYSLDYIYSLHYIVTNNIKIVLQNFNFNRNNLFNTRIINNNED